MVSEIQEANGRMYKLKNKIMIKTILIKNCTDCPHLSHTGQYTSGGAKPCCNHNDTVKQKGNDCFKRVIPYKSNYDNPITIKTPKSIPKWCPLPDST